MQLLRKRPTATWTAAHIAMAKSLVSAGHLTQQRRYDMGLSHTPLRQACHQHMGTPMHRLYACREATALAAPDALPGSQWRHMAASSPSHLLWTRGL